jgi:hypothetical protein
VENPWKKNKGEHNNQKRPNTESAYFVHNSSRFEKYQALQQAALANRPAFLPSFMPSSRAQPELMSAPHLLHEKPQPGVYRGTGLSAHARIAAGVHGHREP